MPKYVLSNRAEQDIINTYQYTADEFGETQADAYLQSLHEGLVILSDNPGLAQNIYNIRPSYYRYQIQKHMAFFRIESESIFVVRILHQQMQFPVHLNSNVGDNE